MTRDKCNLISHEIEKPEIKKPEMKKCLICHEYKKVDEQWEFGVYIKSVDGKTKMELFSVCEPCFDEHKVAFKRLWDLCY